MSCSAYVASLSSELVLHAKDSDTIKQLILNGAEVNYQSPEGWCLLFELISLGLHENIAQLCTKNLDLNVVDNKNRNALFWAIHHENNTVVKTLIAHGINLKNLVSTELPALHYAVYKNHTDIVNTLLEYGVPIESKDAHDITALSYAQHYDRKEMILLLSNKGAIPST